MVPSWGVQLWWIRLTMMRCQGCLAGKACDETPRRRANALPHLQRSPGPYFDNNAEARPIGVSYIGFLSTSPTGTSKWHGHGRAGSPFSRLDESFPMMPCHTHQMSTHMSVRKCGHMGCPSWQPLPWQLVRCRAMVVAARVLLQLVGPLVILCRLDSLH